MIRRLVNRVESTLQYSSLAALPLFAAHMIGTFGVLVMVPDIAFQDGTRCG